MSDLIEQLWPAFLAESNEQLEALELGLIGDSEADARDLPALFRSFHTLKGGCAMMGFVSMEAIAHACEDLLDPVRKGERALDSSLVDALLAAIDCLKRQLAVVEGDHRDPPTDAALLERLRALVAMPSARSSEAAVMATAPANPGTDTSAGHALPNVPDYAVLAAAGRGCLPMLCEAALIELPLAETVPEKLAELEAAARSADAHAVVILLQGLVGASGSRRQALLAELLDRLAWLEESEGLDAGTLDAALGLRRALEPALREAVREVPARFAGLAQGKTGDAVAAVEQLLEQVLLMRLPHSIRLLRQTLQLLREMARGSLPGGSGLADLLQVAAALPGELLEGLEEDAPYQVMCQQLEEKLEQAALRRQQGEDLAARAASWRERLDISAATLAALDAPALDRLEAASARQDTLVELEADMESASDAGRALVDWLGANGTLISNHSIYAPGDATRVSLRFLVGLPLSIEAIRTALAALEPQPAVLTLHHCRLQGEVVTPAAAVAAEPARPAAAGNGAASPAAMMATLRVDSAAVDNVVNRVGEMVMLRNMLSHALHQDDLIVRQGRAAMLLRDRGDGHVLSGADLQELRELLSALAGRHEQLVQTDLRLQGSLSRLQEEALALRVVPIALVFNRLPRVVRDLGQSLNRLVRLDISGEEVRIDKGMVDVLTEPMLHLVRNAIDHGIETPAQRAAAGKPAEALLRIAARQQGNTLVIDVVDDGRGLDYSRIRARAVGSGLVAAAEAEALSPRELGQLIFLPGFSTAEQVTEVSGRGVGMDAVKTRVMQLGGQVEVQSEPGQGTTFTLRMPLSAAIQNVILVDAGGRQLGIPERSVTEIFRLPVAALQTVQGQACCLLRGVTLPLYHLAVLLGHGEFAPASTDSVEVVVMTDGAYRIGVVVERVVGRPEVFLRDIHPDLVRLPGVGGASILGDGRVVIILDCESLFDLAVRHAQSLRSLLRAT